MGPRLRDPALWTGVLQLAKTVGAAVLAYELALRVFALEQPFLAPWSALLTVHATVYRTFRRGAQQVGAAVLGVLLAFGAGTLLGTGAASLALVLGLGLGAGAMRGLRAESTTAASTALVVLLAGYSGDGTMLVARLADTGIGIAVGLLVNLLVMAPLTDRAAAARIDEIDDCLGALLRRMAAALARVEAGPADLEGWIDATRDVDRRLDEAWAGVRQARESAWLNPRRGASARAGAIAGLTDVLGRLEQANAETRSMVRTIATTGTDPERWPGAFFGPWLRALRATGDAIGAADARAVTAVHEDLRALAMVLGDELGGTPEWPVLGALLVNLRNVVEAMGAVADANPVRAAVAVA